MFMSSGKYLLIFALIFFIFGIFSVGDWDARLWVFLTIGTYSIPLVCQIFKSKIFNVYGIWFGVFVIAQTLLTPLFVTSFNYKTLPENFYQKIDLRGDSLPGLNGVQTITTDEMGFRTTNKVNYLSKQNDVLRIVAIGASTTEQLWVDDNFTWTSILEKKLSDNTKYQKVEIINTGLSGLRAVHHLETFRRSIAWKPDVALFLLGINDWNYHIHRAQGSIFMDLDTTPIEFSDSMLGKAILLLKSKWDFRNSKGKQNETKIEYGEFVYSKNNSLAREDIRMFRPQNVLQAYKSTLKKIVLLCKEAQVKCIFITQPSAYHESASSEIKKYFWMTPPKRSYTLNFESLVYIANLYNEFLLEFATVSDITSCDLASKLEPNFDNFYDDCHFNLQGSMHVANELTQCLRQDALIF